MELVVQLLWRVDSSLGRIYNSSQFSYETDISLLLIHLIT
jgi:hypothetical protein